MDNFLSLFQANSYSNFHLFHLLVMFAIGLFLLIKGSDYILVGASQIARLLHVSEYVIGITIVAISTSLPELFVSSSAAIKNLGVISLGNVVGSNIFNILLIFMILCLFSRELFKVSWASISFLTLLNIVLLFFSMYSIDPIPRFIGILFLFVLIMYFVILISQHKKKEKIQLEVSGELSQESKKYKLKDVLNSLILVIVGIIFLYGGTEFFLNATRTLGLRIGISEHVIGIVFVALGTSMPELMVTISAIIKMYTHRKAIKNLSQVDKSSQVKKNSQPNGLTTTGILDIAEGNIIGSNIFNILGVLGFSSILVPIKGITGLPLDIGIMTLIALFLLLLLFQKIIFQKILGILLLIFLIIYLVVLF